MTENKLFNMDGNEHKLVCTYDEIFVNCMPHKVVINGKDSYNYYAKGLGQRRRRAVKEFSGCKLDDECIKCLLMRNIKKENSRKR